MKVAVAGLWHLGCVTAACLSKINHDVIAYDPNPKIIQDLKQGTAPIFEPGLNDLLNQSRIQLSSTSSRDLFAGSSEHSLDPADKPRDDVLDNPLKLNFTSIPEDLNQADILLITFDTPVDEHDIADIEFVMREVKTLLPHLKQNTLVLISSQMPVGSTRKLLDDCSKEFPDKAITFGCMPENLRLGKAIQVFMHPDRFVVGLQDPADREKVTKLLAPITDNIIWMSIESAEMTKHALNAFLATSVVFINEIASLCEHVGANAYEVEMGLKSEERIGPKSYLRPGGAIAGGTLLRDVNYLDQLSQRHHHASNLMSALLKSNQYHKEWLHRKVTSTLSHLKNKTIALLGLTYKPNTNTLRRSSAIETSQWLHQQGAVIQAYDPMIDTLPEDLKHVIDLKTTIPDALKNADALIITTECPQFRNPEINKWISEMTSPLVFDASSFLLSVLSDEYKMNYYAIGRST